MSAAIEGAKRRIWSIASDFINAQPKPDLRIGAVAFRDRGDAYVTRVKDLTADFDALYSFLFSLEAQGGGDVPEDVHAGLEAALEQMSWTPAADPATVRTMFLVGDAPPQFYENKRDYKELAALAVDSGIVINTLVCGADRRTIEAWDAIARLANGQSDRVSQASLRAAASATAESSPYDERIRDLSDSIDKTRYFHGAKAGAAAASLASAKAAVRKSGAAASAARATTTLLAAYSNEFASDVVEEIERGASALEDFDLDEGEREDVRSRLETRRALTSELTELAEQRRRLLSSRSAPAAAGSAVGETGSVGSVAARPADAGWSATVSDWVFRQAKAEGVVLERAAVGSASASSIHEEL